MIKLAPPIKNFDWQDNVSQFFGENYDIYFNKFGIYGHNALDIVVADDKRGFGTPILAAHDGTIESITYDVPHKTKGNGIYLNTPDGKYSTVYWHLASFEVNVGDKVAQGQTIATMGNSGYVRPKPSSECPHCGTHVHFGLRQNYGIEYENYHGGFIDPVPFMLEQGEKLPFVFHRNLFLGNRGSDVAKLQTILRLEGFAEDYDPIGYFGMKTRRDVSRFQKKHGIWPTIGYFWPKTRREAHERWSSFY